MPSREELIAQGPRAYVTIMRHTKIPVAAKDGVVTEVRDVKPGDLIPRADWDRFPERSRRSMINAGFVRDPLTVEINPITNQPPPLLEPKAAVTVMHRPRRYDALGKLVDKDGVPRIEGETRTAPAPGASASVQTLNTEPPKRKRGRPRKVRV